MASMRNGKRINIWVILGAIFLSGCLFAILAAAIWFLLPPLSPRQIPTTDFQVIPAPTLTPVIVGIQQTQTSSANSNATGGIQIGQYVNISGTEGEGLRLREGPGMSYPVKFLGMDSEVFLVKDGPKEQDGFYWFLLVAPYDQNRTGWAASQFLTLVSKQP
jgi:hypothetical protein